MAKTMNGTNMCNSAITTPVKVNIISTGSLTRPLANRSLLTTPSLPSRTAHPSVRTHFGDEVIKEIYPSARMIGGRSVGVCFVATGLAYNKEVFAKSGSKAPTSWQDLIDHKHKQKVVIPPITNGYGLLTLVMMARLNGGSVHFVKPP